MDLAWDIFSEQYARRNMAYEAFLIYSNYWVV